jgi:hypothetical protein
MSNIYIRQTLTSKKGVCGGVVLKISWKEKKSSLLRLRLRAGHQWFMPVILATREAEIRRIVA